MLLTVCCPWDTSSYVKGNLALRDFVFDILCPLSNNFPTAVLMQGEVSNSHPAYMKKMTAAGYNCTVDYWLLCTKQQQAVTSRNERS